MSTKTFSVAINPEEDGPLVEWLNEQPTKSEAILKALRHYYNVVIEQRDKGGFLYVILNPATDAVRIGFSKNPARVLKPLSSMAGVKLEVVVTIPVSAPEIVDLVKEYLAWHEQCYLGSWFHWYKKTRDTIAYIQSKPRDADLRKRLSLETASKRENAAREHFVFSRKQD